MMEEEILLKPKMGDHPRIRRRSSTTRKLPMTSSAWCTWSTGRGRGNLMHRLVLPRSMEAYVERYRSYHTNRYGSSKMREGVVSRISRLKSFLRYMADGHKLISNWKFMFNIGRINRWLVELSKSGKEVTTQRFYIYQLHQFISYLKRNRPDSSRLTNKQILQILDLLEKARRDLKRAIFLHQNRVKRAKMNQVPQRDSILRCIQLAPGFIEESLEKLEKEPKNSSIRYQLYGYLTAYWACVSGHRPGVFINMLDKEVDAGAQEETSEGVLIRVAEHKTSAQFGEATLALTQREFSWVKRLRDIKSRLSIKNKYLLFTMGKLPFRNIVRYLNFAWKKMGLGSAINFILIRTALADSAKSALTPKERNKVSTFVS
ncbi:uncharacterized protein V3H82_018630 [Fundulus diaphanus]